ncbi:hypothetical protein [Candidatus Vallotia tarda]|uniref:hypothetical protein n=1 Tax=Candidatus Vallotiella hemipterorum TaxID=1177213 RepID=UPI001C1FFD22|nr:hypothetical protein [Candidatus Vallotia tarda]
MLVSVPEQAPDTPGKYLRFNVISICLTEALAVRHIIKSKKPANICYDIRKSPLNKVKHPKKEEYQVIKLDIGNQLTPDKIVTDMVRNPLELSNDSDKSLYSRCENLS